ncbi:MAG: hypothetical protein CML29_17960 [Rhizobiales bacterium]|nr:hypothetical protein [Hyphomicrobiales bacterium]MBA69622.1 hypothetical protein [Hyphomicrobiales bacterium]
MLRIAAVVLTHNSDEDLPDCLSGLLNQRGVELDIIVVDNASEPARRKRTANVVRSMVPNAQTIAAGQTVPPDYRGGDGLFVINSTNGGYSAGNNIGARIAAKLGCVAVLIVNPDVRIHIDDYILRLSVALLGDDRNAVAASAIRNLAAASENPMYEPNFIQELLAPFSMILAVLPFGPRYRPSAGSYAADKLSGCCFLIRTTFLEQIGYFDEKVFLYCEEAILAAQIRQAGYRSLCLGDIEALHAHRSSAKGDPVRRWRMWSRSRRYYHRRYLGYGAARRLALAASHRLIIALSWLHSRTSAGAR